jgi:carbon starvation protein CstA
VGVQHRRGRRVGLHPADGLHRPTGRHQHTLFPLFDIANQLLAASALAVVTVVVIKMGLLKWA